MSSSTITPYVTNAATQAFSLVSESATGAKYMVAGREIGLPYVVEVTRKLTAPGATSNDHVGIRIARTERNATTAKLATCQVLLDISIPKDATVITQTEQKKLLSALASLLNEYTAMEATTASITALVEGRNL